MKIPEVIVQLLLDNSLDPAEFMRRHFKWIPKEVAAKRFGVLDNHIGNVWFLPTGQNSEVQFDAYVLDHNRKPLQPSDEEDDPMFGWLGFLTWKGNEPVWEFDMGYWSEGEFYSNQLDEPLRKELSAHANNFFQTEVVPRIRFIKEDKEGSGLDVADFVRGHLGFATFLKPEDRTIGDVVDQGSRWFFQEEYDLIGTLSVRVYDYKSTSGQPESCAVWLHVEPSIYAWMCVDYVNISANFWYSDTDVAHSKAEAVKIIRSAVVDIKTILRVASESIPRSPETNRPASVDAREQIDAAIQTCRTRAKELVSEAKKFNDRT